LADGPDFDAPLLRMAWDFKAQALARETRATAEITKRWADAWRDISRDLARLIERMEAGELTPRETIRGQLYRRARAEELLARIRADLDELTGSAENIIGKAQIAEVDAALADTEKLVLATAPDVATAKRLAAIWVRVPTDAAQMLTGALQPITPLGALLAELGPTTAAGISQELTAGLITGRNPRVVARRIRDQWGLSLTRATRISRTETMRAYRAASLYQYQQNPGMVKGWRWICSFSERTCIGCIINHGKVFPVTTPFADHVQGRCIPSPVLASWRELGVDIDDPKPLINEGDGWKWFEWSPESTQRRILGDPIYNAWKQGLVGKDQLWHVHHDDQWGDSIVASSLKRAMTAPRE